MVHILTKFNEKQCIPLWAEIHQPVKWRDTDGRPQFDSLREQRYAGVSKSFRTGLLKRELQMVKFSATRCSCNAILWVSLVSFAVLTPCVASQRVIPKVSVHFVIESVRKLLDTPSYSSPLTYPVSHLMSIEGSSSGAKTVRAWGWPLNYI
jgi:hypothetical protein